MVACKDSTIDSSKEGLTGKWKLIKYCKPTGTTTCSEVIIPANKSVFIEFTKNNKFDEYYKNTIPVEYAFLGCFNGTYTIEDKNVRIIAGCMSSSTGKLISIVSLSKNQLILNPFGSGEYIFEKE